MRVTASLYLEMIKISFRNNLVFKTDYIVGIVNNLLAIFVSVAIWKAIYGHEKSISGIRMDNLVTYVSLSLMLQAVFVMDDFYMDRKIRTGAMATDLIRPLDFRLYLFSHITSNLLFKLIMQLMPALVVVVLIFDIAYPANVQMGLMFLLNLILGYLIIYNLNFIFWVSSFWFHVSWSLITIKDAFITIFSGAVLPLWFMPDPIQQFLKYTPFDSILHIPISIYLGTVKYDEMLFYTVRQLAWILALYITGWILWSRGMRKLTVQGG